MKKTKTKKAGKSVKDKLTDGAADIRRAEKEAKEAPKTTKKKAELAILPLVKIPPLTRPIEEIIKDQERVKVLDGSIGLKIADDTPIEENLAILKWATTMSNHVGFMIGDVLLAGEANKVYGHEYDRALAQTGYALTTLQICKSVAKSVPHNKRIAALSFSHYENIQGLLTEPKVIELVEKIGKEVSAGRKKITKAELRIKALEVAPKKKKALKKATSGKGKKGKKKE